MNAPSPISEAELHAYVDAQLPAVRHAEVEAWLAGQPEAAARVAAYRQQNEALRDLFQPELAAPLPDALCRLAEPPPAVDRQGRGFFPRASLQRLAASVLIGLLGGAAGWLAHGVFQAGAGQQAQMLPLPRQAAVAHVVFSPDMRRPVEISGDQEEQLVKWLSKRLATPVNPPKLGNLGYALVGGRLLPGNRGPVAQFMYQDAAGLRLTLYLTPESLPATDVGFRFAREGDVNVFYWVDRQFGYALSGVIDKGELARIATAVYDQMAK